MGLEPSVTRTTAGILVAAVAAGCAASRPAATPEVVAACRCKPGQPCWPSATQWQRFGATLHGKLEQPRSPLDPCTSDMAGEACAAALRNVRNPFYLQDQAGGTQSTGWLGAWAAAQSAYGVVAEDTADIQAAVNFARRNGLRLVVKGTGHDYLGRSNAPDSLLVWTHKMRRISMHDMFVPDGCPGTEPSPAVSVEAGTRWLEAYQEVTVRNGRYVQGGGCTTVGAAGGFLQGGGFGSWSRRFGIAAASMLEAEVVTADGMLLIANSCQNQDLFWALRGGGGGTYGIVTRVTLKTHPLPAFFGGVDGKIVAKSNAAFKDLIERFLLFYRERLNNEHWGEQVRFRSDNSLSISMVFADLRKSEAEEVWQPFRDFVASNATAYTMELDTYEVAGNRLWNTPFLQKYAPEAIHRDERAGEPADRFWWAGDADQVSTYWYAYQSRWVPLELFDATNAKAFASTLFEASRHWSIAFHFNKAQAGASSEAVTRGRETAMNPAVFRAAALIIVAADGPGFPGVPGREPDKAEAENAKEKVSEAMKLIREATPGAGSYVNETDYFEPDWQQSFWGENYQRLSEIKHKYDPAGLFYCHHCVGSEDWSEGGMCMATK
jgi:FAD/FMN-containing dehydrogenase